MIVTGRQFWMGTHRAGMVARIWADADLIHVLIGGTRVKTVRSHLSVNDLAKLVAQGASNAGPSPLPPVEDGDAVEVERAVSRLGHVSLAWDWQVRPKGWFRLLGPLVGPLGGRMERRIWTGLKHKLENDGDARTS